MESSYLHVSVGPCNMALLLQFLDQLYHHILQLEGKPGQPDQAHYIVIWNSMSFHQAALVCTWFNDHPRFTSIFLPAYSPISDRGIFFDMVMESIWLQSLSTAKPPRGNGGHLWWCVHRVYPGSDKANEGIFPMLPGKRKPPLWLWSDIMAWPSTKMRWNCWCTITCTFTEFVNKAFGNWIFYYVWTLPSMCFSVTSQWSGFVPKDQIQYYSLIQWI